MKPKKFAIIILSLLFVFTTNLSVYCAGANNNIEIEYITNFNDSYTPIGEDYFYTHNNGALIIDKYGNYLFSPGKYDYPESDNEKNLKTYSDNKWCRAYKDKFVIINNDNEIAVISGTGELLTDFSNDGYTLYNENFAFCGIIRNADEIDKIIDLNSGNYITDQKIIDEIKSSNLPENQFGNYDKEYSSSNIDYINYSQNLPEGYYAYRSYSPSDSDRIVTIISTDKDYNFYNANKNTYTALYCDGEFITEPDLVKIEPVFQGKGFLIYNYVTDLYSIVDSYGNSVLNNQRECYALNADIVQTDNGLIRIKNASDITKEENNSSTKNLTHSINCSKWAEKEIIEAIDNNIVPSELQNNYTDKITRGDFCKLAVYTILAYENMSIDEYFSYSDKVFNYTAGWKKFFDTDDKHIKFAVDIGIANGISENQFAPDNYITRQEAAVMLNNSTKILGIESNYDTSNTFTDENYFADWARESIYRIYNIKVMSGTENDKFSPWMNYTREQAIATMNRLYSLKNTLSFKWNTESTTDSQNKDNITEETSLSEITTSYSNSISNKEEAEQKISEFLHNNKEITDNISAIDYVGDNKFLVYWGAYSSIFEVYQCNYCALVDIKGKYIIPKTDNLIINIGYGKFVEYSYDTDNIGPYKGYNRDNYKIYNIDGAILNLEYYDLSINDSMGLTEANIKKIEKQTGENASLILEASDLGLIPYDKNPYYNQFDWNITNQQFYDFIVNLYETIGGHNGIDTDLKRILSDSNSFDPFEDMTKAKAEKAFSFLLEQLDEKNILDDVFANKNPECYTIEDTTVTVYKIYKYLTE